MNNFCTSITVQGTVHSVDAQQDRCELLLRSGDIWTVYFGSETSFNVMTNVDGVARDNVPEPENPPNGDLHRKVAKYVRPKDVLMVRGILQEHERSKRFDATRVDLMHHFPGRFLFEETHWWLSQSSRLADAWLDDLFGDARSYREDDFSALYRTNLNILGGKTDDNLQAMATLSRLIYGLSSTYLLTGDRRYLAAAGAGVEFQRSAFRSLSHDGRYCFWAYGRRKYVDGTATIMASENPDDAGSIPLYEQIYALAGMTQYYRITQDPGVLDDIHRTICAFNRFFLDSKSVDETYPGLDGWFSHLDPNTMRPDSASLGPRASRKNWNSIGDHIPAYLLNLLLALDPLPEGADATVDQLRRTCVDMVDRCTRLIIDKFPDPESTFVNERFFADWKPEHTWGWQQNRAIVGHNYKIAWNLTRVASYYLQQGRKEDASRAMVLAERLGLAMVQAGSDLIRGGCFDAVERNPTTGVPIQFVWGSTKDFWQQEQAILANLILHGYTGRSEYLDQARAMEAFWNMFFLDRDRHGVYFRVTENGNPVVEGAYADKAGYPVAGYHTFELNYLAHIYTRAYVAPVVDTNASFCLYFHPCAESGLGSINVAPDALKPGTFEIESITIGGRPREGFVPDRFQIQLRAEDLGREVRVRFRTKAGQR